MRGLTSTIVLLVILGGLGAFIYYDKDNNPGAEPPKAKVFDNVTADKIDEITFKSDTGEVSSVQRAGDGWHIVQPAAANADKTEVEAVTTSLSDVEVERVVDENASDLKEYGLEPAKFEVGFRLKDQKNEQRLLVGAQTPTGTDMYARTPNSKRVFLIPTYLQTTFNKTAFALRDKTILAFDRENANAVNISGAAPLSFQKTGNEWRMTRPIAARAEYSTVDALVVRLATAKMQAIVEAEPKNLKQYQLDTPRMTVEVATTSGKATLLVGEPDAAGDPYAKDAAHPAVFTFEKSLLDEFNKKPEEFRRKEVFDFRAFNARHLEIHRGGTTYTLDKSKGADGNDVWKDGSGKTLETAIMYDVLTKISAIRASAFEPAANPSVKTPALTVVATFDNGGSKTETLNFGKVGDDVYAARTDEPGGARIEASDFVDALKALDGVK